MRNKLLIKHTTKSIILALFFGITFVLGDILIDTYVFREGSLSQQLFSPEASEIYIRTLILLLFLCFGFIISFSIKNLERNKESFKKLSEELKEKNELLSSQTRAAERLSEVAQKEARIAKEQQEELIKANKCMIGREQKMIDLKEEVDGLLRKFGQKPRYKI